MTSKARQLADLGGDTANLEDISSAYSSGALSNRNLIINSAMQVAQRGTSATSVSTEGYKCVDRFRWNMDDTSAVFTLSQSTDVPTGEGFSNSFKAEVTTADTSLAAANQIRFEYRFEGQDVQQLAKGTSNAKKVTLSFWVKAFQTGTYVINLQDTDNTRLIAATYTVDASGTWEYKTVTLDGDTSGALTSDANLSLVLHWYLGAGSNYTSGTLATSWESVTNANRAVGQTVDITASTSNYWAITGVQLEAGDTATPFEHRSYGAELALCQRYYIQYDENDEFRAAATATGTTSMEGLVSLPVQMRTTPTVTTSASIYNIVRGITNANRTISGTAGTTSKLISITCAAPSSTSGTDTGIIYTDTSQFVKCSAEL